MSLSNIWKHFAQGGNYSFKSVSEKFMSESSGSKYWEELRTQIYLGMNIKWDLKVRFIPLEFSGSSFSLRMTLRKYTDLCSPNTFWM